MFITIEDKSIVNSVKVKKTNPFGKTREFFKLHPRKLFTKENRFYPKTNKSIPASPPCAPLTRNNIPIPIVI